MQNKTGQKESTAKIRNFSHSLSLSLQHECTSVRSGRDNLRDSSTSTLTLEAAFERLVKTLLTFFSSLAVSVNLESRATFSNNFRDSQVADWLAGNIILAPRRHNDVNNDDESTQFSLSLYLLAFTISLIVTRATSISPAKNARRDSREISFVTRRQSRDNRSRTRKGARCNCRAGGITQIKK